MQQRRFNTVLLKFLTIGYFATQRRQRLNMLPTVNCARWMRSPGFVERLRKTDA